MDGQKALNSNLLQGGTPSNLMAFLRNDFYLLLWPDEVLSGPFVM
jgi:hypothetical protein